MVETGVLLILARIQDLVELGEFVGVSIGPPDAVVNAALIPANEVQLVLEPVESGRMVHAVTGTKPCREAGRLPGFVGQEGLLGADVPDDRFRRLPEILELANNAALLGKLGVGAVHNVVHRGVYGVKTRRLS